MIHFKPAGSDMFQGNHECLINTVNTTGVMGAGIAAVMMQKFPTACTQFNNLCKEMFLPGGTILLYPNRDSDTPKLIMMFATKQEVWNPSTYTYIQLGLKEMVKYVKYYNITNIGVPPLGCGYGGLEWQKVRAMILEAVEPIKDTCEIYIYEQ
jgi:O-acetyl-ADP-ribose deacetylase (regulator of RNase III)